MGSCPPPLAGLGGGEVAAVVLETIPASYGFPLPAPGYLAGVKRRCERHRAVHVADEVRSGLGRTGRSPMWRVGCCDVEPDILLAGKRRSGWLHPISATAVTRRVAGWLEEDGCGHVSTFGGAAIGCPVAERVLEITPRPGTLANAAVSAQLGDGLERLRRVFPGWLLEVRRLAVRGRGAMPLAAAAARR